MTRAEANDILDQFEDAIQSYHECEAEAGMGAVAGGWSGYDGMSVYRSMHPYPQPDADVIEARRVLALDSPFQAVALITVDTTDDLPF